MIITRYKCTVCGKVTGGRHDRGLDGKTRYPRLHWDGRVKDARCLGSFRAAEPVDVEFTIARKTAL